LDIEKELFQSNGSEEGPKLISFEPIISNEFSGTPDELRKQWNKWLPKFDGSGITSARKHVQDFG